LYTPFFKGTLLAIHFASLFPPCLCIESIALYLCYLFIVTLQGLLVSPRMI